MPYPNWSTIDRGLSREHPKFGRQIMLAKACQHTPGSVFVEMASGAREHPGSVYLGLSLDREAAEHLMACIDEVFGVEPEYADDPLHPVLECVG